MKIDEDSGESDLDFLLACQAGDLGAFSALYTRHGPVIMRYAWSRLGDRSLAEDVLQETFATAWAKIRKSTIVDKSLLPWLLAICANHLRNQSRRALRHHTVLLDESHDRAKDDVGDLAPIAMALGRLSPLDRQICELCLIEGFTYREAAARIQSTPAAVRNRLQRARGRLRDLLAEDEI